MKFSDVLDIQNGRNQRQVENANGKYPIYGSGGVMGRATDFICDAETVVIGRKGSINNPIFVDEPFWNVDTAFGLVAHRDVLLPKYLFYFCVNFDFERLNTTVTIPSLTKANLLQIEINVPDMDEQRHVVSVLDKICRLTDLQQQELHNLDQLVKSRFIELFGDPVSNPRNLPITSLGELSDLITKGASPSWQGFSYTDDESQTLFVTSENVREGYIDISNPKYIEDGFNAKQKRSVLKKGDFLINIVGASIGRAAQFNLDCKANINQAAALVRVTDKRIRDKYLLIYLNSEKALQMYDSMKSDTGRANLSLQDIGSLSILIPPVEEQIAFEAFIEQTDKSKYYSSLSFRYCRAAANTYRQEWMTCRTSDF